jgi:hypothetical protein
MTGLKHCPELLQRAILPWLQLQCNGQLVDDGIGLLHHESVELFNSLEVVVLHVSEHSVSSRLFDGAQFLFCLLGGLTC